jgi:hypothetical protein
MYPWVLLISLGLDEWQNTIPSMLSVYISELVFSAEKNDKQHNCRIRNICDYDAGRPYNLLQSQWRMVSVLSFLRSHHNLEKRGDEKCRDRSGQATRPFLARGCRRGLLAANGLAAGWHSLRGNEKLPGRSAVHRVLLCIAAKLGAQ